MNWFPLKLKVAPTGIHSTIRCSTYISSDFDPTWMLAIREYAIFDITSNGVRFHPGYRMPKFLNCGTSNRNVDYRITGEPVPFDLVPGDDRWMGSDEEYSLKWYLHRGTAILRAVRRDGSIPLNGNLVGITPDRHLHILKSSGWRCIGVPTTQDNTIPVILP